MEGAISVTQSKYSDEVYTGCVKWFNRSSGWGFLTVTSSEEQDDIFVHWNALSVDKEQYRYLVNGEYVTFKVSFNKDAKHSYQAEEVRGVNGGLLMCETRNEQLRSRPQTTNSSTRNEQLRSRPQTTNSSTRSGAGVKHERVNPRGRGPRGGRQSRRGNTTHHEQLVVRDENGEEWVMHRK